MPSTPARPHTIHTCVTARRSVLEMASKSAADSAAPSPAGGAGGKRSGSPASPQQAPSRCFRTGFTC
eukprot:26181-Chlamydomonas_euryale.AAC.4